MVLQNTKKTGEIMVARYSGGGGGGCGIRGFHIAFSGPSGLGCSSIAGPSGQGCSTIARRKRTHMHDEIEKEVSL